MDLCLQMSKTRVINRNLNPVWDEELMLSVPNPPPSLKLVSCTYFGIVRFGELEQLNLHLHWLLNVWGDEFKFGHQKCFKKLTDW